MSIDSLKGEEKATTPARISIVPDPEMEPVAITSAAKEDEEKLNRFWVALLVAFLGMVGVLLTITGGNGGFQGLLVAILLHTVPGLAIAVVYRLHGLDLILSGVVGSLAVLILCSLPMALASFWHPRVMATLILLASTAVAVWVACKRPPTLEATWMHRTGRAMIGPIGLATAGFLVAVLAAGIQPQPPALYGAALAAGPLWFLGLGAIVFAVCWAFSSVGGRSWSIVLLATVVPMSQAVMYGTPTVQVAARHIGLVNLLITHGGLDREAGIYQAYSGLFASSALVQQAAGWPDLMMYAAVFGAVGAGVNCLAVAQLARYFVDDERAWWAGLVFALGSSLTTSFYAPQVAGLALVTTATTALLRNSTGLKWPRVWAALALSIAVAPTHQLSPFLATLICIALVVVRLMKVWWSPVVLVAPAVIWALLNRGVLKSYVSLDELFNVLANFKTPSRPSSSALSADLVNRVTFWVPSIALVCIGVAALVALIRFHNRMTLGLALAAASPVALFAANSYGSEGIFRVSLFCLPWLAIIGSINLPRTGRRFWTVPWHPVRNAGVVALTAVFIIGTTGMDYTRVINPENVKAVAWVEEHVTDETKVFALGTTLAEPVLISGKDTFYISRELLLRDETTEIYPAKTGADYDPQADLEMLMQHWMKARAKVRYVLASERMKAFDERYGQQLASDQTRLEQALRATPGVTVAYQGDGVTVYELPEGNGS